jgi:hypothetical protein
LKKINLLIFILFFSFLNAKVFATETIFNVPSADITPKGRIYLLEEAQTTPWWQDDLFYSTTYATYGVGHNTELNAILFNVGSPATEDISLGVGAKTAIPLLKEQFPKREFKLTVGSQVLIGLEGNNVGNWTYAHLSGRVPKLNTRLSAGISYGTKQAFGVEKTAFICGVEQPVTKKISLLGDWYSGSEHWSGYLIVGGSYAINKDTTFYAGFQLPNTPKVGSSGFVLQIGKYF